MNAKAHSVPRPLNTFYVVKLISFFFSTLNTLSGRYLDDLVARREEWAIAFRSGVLLRGHHTNNFAESTMGIIKDVVLDRYYFMNVWYIGVVDKYVCDVAKVF